MNHYRPTQSTMRRLGVVTFAGAVACAGGLVTMLGLGGQVDALDDTPAKFEPVVPDDLDLSDLTEPTLPEVPTLDVPIATLPEGPDGPIFDGPIVTIPGESDGPIFDGPIVTIPQGPDGPIFDGPIVTIPINPDDTIPPQETTPPQRRPRRRRRHRRPILRPRTHFRPTSCCSCLTWRSPPPRSTARGCSTSPTRLAPTHNWRRRTSTS